LGLNTKVERGGRVFPVSDRAGEVVELLEEFLKVNKVIVHYEEPVEKLIVDNNVIKGIATKKNPTFLCDSVIIATGGLSYPGTGSTGDGYSIAKAVGHKVTNLYPSLVPFNIEQKWCSELQGLSLKNIAISIRNSDKREIYKDFGELLFTHYGVSGPVILSASRTVVNHIKDGLSLIIDLKPALDEKTLDSRILRDFEKFKNKAFKNSLDELLPQKLIPVIISLSDIPENKKVNEITKQERKKICDLIKKMTLHITSTRGYNEAVVTMGGIDVTQIDPSTMQSKIIKNLFFAGEVIDVDAYTGGYNLQIAFSTGYTAGINA
jgi:predicted Rossmann fold flavoprotein